MNTEQLLKSISKIIKKNELFLINNPEIFNVIENRLHKAIDYEDYESEEDPDYDEDYNSDESGISDLFDDNSEDEDSYGEEDLEDDDASKWIEQNEEKSDGSDINSNEKVQPNKNVSASGYRGWSPKDSYEEEHQAGMDEHMNDGWSHREAERFVGAHDSPTNFNDALKSKTKPSQPSEKMLAEMKGLSKEWLKNAERKIGETADARKNPIKYAAAKTLSSHEGAHKDFKTAYDEFLASDDMADKKGRERHKAISAFKKDWHEENPEHRENTINAADSGKAFKEADETRAQHLLEGHLNIQDAGKSSGGLSTSGEFSESASGDTDNLTSQGAAQMVGGSQDEGGYTSSTVKDPAAVFSEKNQDYLKSEKRKKSIQNLKSRLTPEMNERFTALQGISKKGDK